MYLAQVIRYDILYTVNQLARSISKLAKAHMGEAKHLLRYLLGPQISPSPTSRTGSGLLPSRMPTETKTPTTVGLRHHTS